VFIDPAHGGPETGATLVDNALEKNVTLALANQLRTALTAAGFTVVSTRDGDLTEPLTTDQRAEIANRSHAIACLVLHATGTGSGVHVYTTTLQPLPAQAAGTEEFVPVLWDSAQVEYAGQSLRLSGDVMSALKKANLPAISGAAAVRPLDNLMCPALAIEIAPLAISGSTTTPVTSTSYQQRVAALVAGALKDWRDHAEPPAGPTKKLSAGAQP